MTTLGEVSATGLARAEGVLIVHVPPDSAAAQAGLRNNDVILGLNSAAVRDVRELESAWRSTSSKKYRLTVWRDQTTCEIELGTTH
jgi:S1-C subfamily serine protease